jgi:hypothetical protein
MLLPPQPGGAFPKLSICFDEIFAALTRRAGT